MRDYWTISVGPCPYIDGRGGWIWWAEYSRGEVRLSCLTRYDTEQEAREAAKHFLTKEGEIYA